MPSLKNTFLFWGQHQTLIILFLSDLWLSIFCTYSSSSKNNMKSGQLSRVWVALPQTFKDNCHYIVVHVHTANIGRSSWASKFQSLTWEPICTPWNPEGETKACQNKSTFKKGNSSSKWRFFKANINIKVWTFQDC